MQTDRYRYDYPDMRSYYVRHVKVHCLFKRSKTCIYKFIFNEDHHWFTGHKSRSKGCIGSIDHRAYTSLCKLYSAGDMESGDAMLSCQ